MSYDILKTLSDNQLQEDMWELDEDRKLLRRRIQKTGLMQGDEEKLKAMNIWVMKLLEERIRRSKLKTATAS